MTYQLGIDFGSTTVVAAVHRAEGPGAAEVVPLGGGGRHRALRAAPRARRRRDRRRGRARGSPGSTRVASSGPSSGAWAIRPRSRSAAGRGRPRTCRARLVRWVVDRVAEREGGPATRIALAHPAPWAAPTLERLAAALAGVDVHVDVRAPSRWRVAHAAARGRRAGRHDRGLRLRRRPVRRGRAAPRRDARGGSRLLGGRRGWPTSAASISTTLVWQHVRAGLPEGVVPDARVRRACLRAKETLSTKAEAVVRVRQGELRGEVAPRSGHVRGARRRRTSTGRSTVLRRAVASAGLAPEELTAVLLVGGSARIPLVARTVSAQLGRAVAVLDDPGWVARGAALAVPTVTVDGAGRCRAGSRRRPASRHARRAEVAPRWPRGGDGRRRVIRAAGSAGGRPLAADGAAVGPVAGDPRRVVADSVRDAR